VLFGVLREIKVPSSRFWHGPGARNPPGPPAGLPARRPDCRYFAIALFLFG